MTDQLQNSFLQALLPRPEKITLRDGGFFKLEHGACAVLCGPAAIQAEALEIFGLYSREFWHLELNVTYKAADQAFPAEGYAVRISADTLTVSAGASAGFRYALYTLRQLAQTQRGVMLFDSFVLPQCEIEDAPALPFRGLHLCWFPETTAADIEKSIRLAAYLKFNAVVLESWGIFPFDCAPDFCWKDKKVPRAVFAHLVRLAKELGLELIPQINITGHASWSRHSSGKHAILDFAPQYDALFEQDGWCWCFSNPETRKLLTAMIEEIHDAFGRPPHFHIGCDEAYSLGTCCECAKHDTAKLFKEHLIYFHNLLKARGARTMLWHDMFLDREDPEYEGFVRSGRKEFVAMTGELPKDLLICDWQYCGTHPNSPLDFDWKSSQFFFDRGFDTVLCPWEDPQNAKSQAAYMKRHPEHGKGILVTTWHHFWGQKFTNMIGVPAQANWNPDAGAATLQMGRYVRQIDNDMGLSRYEDFGFNNDYQVDPEAYPTCM